MAEQKARSARARKAAAAEPTLDDETQVLDGDDVEQVAYPDGIDASEVLDEAAAEDEAVGPVNPESLMRAGGYVNRDDGRGWVLEDEE